MKDWKSTIRTWEANEDKFATHEEKEEKRQREKRRNNKSEGVKNE